MSEKAILDGLPVKSLKGEDETYCPRRKTAKIAGLDRDWKICALKGGKSAKVGEIPSQTSPVSLPTSSAQALLMTPGLQTPPKPRGRPKLPKGVKSKCQRARRNGIWVPGECARTPQMKHQCDPSTARWVDVVRFPKSSKRIMEQRCQCVSSGNKNIMPDRICRARHGEKQAPRPASQEEARAAGVGRKTKRRK